MSGRKVDLSSYILDDSIDFSDRNFIRWIYFYNIRTNYMITNTGDVISVRKYTKKYMRHHIDEDGYHRVSLRINNAYYNIGIHRLVAMAFIDIPKIYKDAGFKIDDLQINHINGKVYDNRFENLEWCTPKENIVHAWNNNLAKAKMLDDHPNAVYSNSQIHQVCNLLTKNKHTMKEISKITNVSYTIVKQIKNHIIWNEISKKYDFSKYNVDGRKKER